MKNIVDSYVNKFLQARRERIRLGCFLLAMAMLVSCSVFWRLHYTGVALTNETFCGQEEHTHTEECYTTELVCGLDESEDHTHDESCYETTLTCGKEEHTHTVECLIDETADVETADDWEATLPTLSGVLADDVVAVAESQLGYTESAANFTLADDGETRQGYTRYGAWYGEGFEYVDWDAMFASFCLYYGGVDEGDFPFSSGAYAWTASLSGADRYEAAADADPAPGDLVFFDTDSDGKADHVGIVTEATEGGLTAIEGDTANTDGVDAVCEKDYDLTDSTILGYGVLTAEEEAEASAAEPEAETETTSDSEPEPEAASEAEAEESAEAGTSVASDDGENSISVASDDGENSISVASDDGENNISVASDDGDAGIATVAEEDDVTASGTCGTNLTWTLTSDGVLTISGTGAMTNYTKTNYAPWSSYSSSITSVVIEDGVTSIGNYAFYYCRYISSITIPDSVISIGSYAFYVCSSLTSITIPNSVTSIGSYAFESCSSLVGIELPDSLRAISSYAFWGCTSLTNITIPEGVTSIGEYAFRGCTSLADIELPDTLTSIGGYAFYSCTSLADIELPDTLTSIGGYAFYSCTSLTDIDLSGCTALTSIGDYAFKGCTSLVGIDLSDCTALTSIGIHAFENCTWLESVDIPDSITSIGSSAFQNCTSLADIDLSGCTKLTSIGGYAFYNCDSLEAVDLSGCTKLTAITAYIFYDCDALTSVNLPASVKTIGNYAFYDCEALTDVDFPDSLTSIGDYAFYDCDTLETVDLSACTELTSIGTYAFYDCGALTDVDFPDSLTSIGAYAFYGSGLTGITIPVGADSIGAYAFAYSSGLAEVNGETTLSGAMEAVNTEDGTVFFATALTTIDVTSVSDPIVLEEAGITLTLSATTPTDTILLTGETAYVNFALGVVKNDDNADYVLRIYVLASGEDCDLNYSLDVGSYTITLDGATIPLTVSLVDGIPGFYCIEIKGSDLTEGSSNTNPLTILYETGSSGGGTAKVFAEIISADSAASSAWPSSASYDGYTFSWMTEADDFYITNTAVSTAASTVGTEDGVFIQGVKYTVSFARNGDPKNSSNGKDYITSVDFAATLILGDDLEWRDGVIQAIQAWHYRYVCNSSTGVYGIFVTIDGVEYQLAGSSYDVGDMTAYVDGEGNVVLCWTQTNSTPKAAEITVSDLTLTLGSEVLQVDTDTVTEGETLTVTSSVTATQHFNYSADQTDTAEAAKTTSVSGGKLVMDKNGDVVYKPGASTAISAQGAVRAGNTLSFTITASNPGAMPYTQLRYIDDQLSNKLYIKPEDMQALFDEDTAHQLTITLANATLCTPVENTVTNMEGDTVTITQQLQGTTTTYEVSDDTDVMGIKTDSTLIDDSATITLTWAEGEDYLVMTVSYTEGGVAKTESVSIGAGKSYTSIEDALNAFGYTVTYYVTYQLVWDLGEDFRLQAGQTISHTYNATVKDTFMLLQGDMDYNLYGGSSWLVSSSKVNQNYVYGKDSNGTTKAYDYIQFGIYSEFSLEKDDTVVLREDEDANDGTLVEVTDGTLTAGDVIGYTVTLTHYGYSTYDALPLVDKMAGGQQLLVPVELNSSLATEGLRTMKVDGEEYYILSKTGTYQNVYVTSDKLADHVEVTVDADGSVTTMIYWYLTIYSAYTNLHSTSVYNTETVSYYALVSPADGEYASDYSFTLENIVWLNDHDTHRLYEGAFVGGSVIGITKGIVTDLGADEDDPADDTVEERTSVSEGEKVTYRFTLSTFGSAYVTIRGSNIYDALPKSVSGNPWTADDVTVTFYWEDASVTGDTALWSQQGDGGTVSGWYVTSDAPSGYPSSTDGTQQFLCWSSDLSFRFSGTIYVYVTLTYPKNDGADMAWKDYCTAYGAVDLENELHLFQLNSSVTHYLKVASSAYLQKGVYSTGYVYTSAYTWTDEDSLNVYLNDANAYRGYVDYYILLYNDGVTNLYLNEIQDVLPKGFVYYGTVSSPTLTVTNADGTTSTRKTASVSGTTSTNADGRQVVTFTLAAKTTQFNLSYSEIYSMYYLAPGESIAFSYRVYTNEYQNTEDYAENIVAMAFYDYSGAGVEVSDGVTVSTSTTKTPNDGTCTLENTTWAVSQGMTADEDDEQWLTSSVVMRRGEVAPGITKTTDTPVVASTDSVDWTVTVTNSGNSVMSDYTITDVMELPYAFSGTVTYTVYSGDEFGRLNATTTYSFDLGTRTSSSGDFTATSSGKNLTGLTLNVTKDSAGNEVLTLAVTEEYFALVPGGYAVLTITTRPGGTLANTTYYNHCYITPTQAFDQYGITQGTYVDSDSYVSSPSVVTTSQISTYHGYGTTSEKTVTEDGYSSNTASCFSTTNYIVLHDENSTFRYTLSITNGTETDGSTMDQLVMIDSLPGVGDTGVFAASGSRYSEFNVVLADDPNWTVTVTEPGGSPTVLSSSYYTIEYSTATSFTDDDWSGASIWSDTYVAGTTVSFRIIFDLDVYPDLVPAGAEITVSFNAKAAGGQTINAGAIAWNSFGYRYSVVDDASTLSAAPGKVGVKTPSAPMLIKELETSEGDTYTAEADATFTFVLYKGSAVTGVWTTQDDLIALLEADNIPYTITTQTVAKDSSSSTLTSLKDMLYVYSGGTATATKWTWTDNGSYTIVEIPDSAAYEFGSWNNRSTASYTFTYDRTTTLRLTCVNRVPVWDIDLLKVDESETNVTLSGAVFGLYSSNEKDKVAQADIQTLLDDYDLTYSNVATIQDDNSTTWYLCGIEVTGSSGTLSWSGLLRDTYYLKELVAPNNYQLDSTLREASKTAASNGEVLTLTITNAQGGYELPSAGGEGTILYTMAGLLLTCGAAYLLYRSWRRRRGCVV